VQAQGRQVLADQIALRRQEAVVAKRRAAVEEQERAAKELVQSGEERNTHEARSLNARRKRQEVEERMAREQLAGAERQLEQERKRIVAEQQHIVAAMKRQGERTAEKKAEMDRRRKAEVRANREQQAQLQREREAVAAKLHAVRADAAAVAAAQQEIVAAGGGGGARANDIDCGFNDDCRLFLKHAFPGMRCANFAPAHDRCYCERCWDAAANRMLEIDADHAPYVVPVGWARFALDVPVGRVAQHDIFNAWAVSFHGQSPLVITSILREGAFKLPGDKLFDGSTLRAKKCAGRQNREFFTSPTICYAGLGFYAEPVAYTAADGSRRYGQAVLQCRQDPDSFLTQGQTMAFPHSAVLCHTWPNKRTVERVSEQTGNIIPYGIMIRTFAEGADPQFFRSPVDT
jgi:hypothetical protein